MIEPEQEPGPEPFSVPHTSLPLPSLKDPSYVNAMIHFYRGELGRIMVWRQRLDQTTQWAIASTTTIVTVAFSFRDLPHIIFFFNLAIVAMMLWIEARRYRFYDAFRGRVRMLESHFLVPMISQSDKLLDGEWRRLVCEDLIMPTFKISALESVARRLRRNYVFIFAIIMLAWSLKIVMHADPVIDSASTLYSAFAVAALPAWLNIFIFIGTILFVGWMIVFISSRSSGEISEFGGNGSLWRI